MTSLFIEKSLEIQAPVSKVWEVLTGASFIQQWANAFGAGTSAESDWKLGSDVVWKNNDGKIIVRGQVIALEQEALLRVAYAEIADTSKPFEASGYTETFKLSNVKGHTFLEFRAGPAQEDEFLKMSDMWSKALEGMRRSAE